MGVMAGAPQREHAAGAVRSHSGQQDGGEFFRTNRDEAFKKSVHRRAIGGVDGVGCVVESSVCADDKMVVASRQPYLSRSR